jgi:surface protein
VFNQPLSFDTSMVTNMYRMFEVRSARALTLQPLQTAPLSLRATCPGTAPRPPASRSAPRSASHSYALPSTRQWAGKFNQPLSSFDTSKVTSMDSMFRVRSARALCAPQALSRAFLAHAAGAVPSPHTPCCLPASPDRIACPPFDSAGGCSVRPATQHVRHLQGHEHGLHVLCALVPCPPSLESDPRRAHRFAPQPTHPQALPPPGPHSLRIVLLPPVL